MQWRGGARVIWFCISQNRFGLAVLFGESFVVLMFVLSILFTWESRLCSRGHYVGSWHCFALPLLDSRWQIEWMFDLFRTGQHSIGWHCVYKYYINCIPLNWHFTHSSFLPRHFFVHSSWCLSEVKAICHCERGLTEINWLVNKYNLIFACTPCRTTAYEGWRNSYHRDLCWMQTSTESVALIWSCHLLFDKHDWFCWLESIQISSASIFIFHQFTNISLTMWQIHRKYTNYLQNIHVVHGAFLFKSAWTMWVQVEIENIWTMFKLERNNVRFRDGGFCVFPYTSAWMNCSANSETNCFMQLTLDCANFVAILRRVVPSTISCFPLNRYSRSIFQNLKQFSMEAFKHKATKVTR